MAMGRASRLSTARRCTRLYGVRTSAFHPPPPPWGLSHRGSHNTISDLVAAPSCARGPCALSLVPPVFLLWCRTPPAPLLWKPGGAHRHSRGKAGRRGATVVVLYCVPAISSSSPPFSFSSFSTSLSLACPLRCCGCLTGSTSSPSYPPSLPPSPQTHAHTHTPTQTRPLARTHGTAFTVSRLAPVLFSVGVLALARLRRQ